MSEQVDAVEHVARAMWAARLKRRGYDAAEAQLIIASDDPTPDELAQARAAIEAMREITPVVRDRQGLPFHQLSGAPDDIWRMMIDTALAP